MPSSEFSHGVRRFFASLYSSDANDAAPAAAAHRPSLSADPQMSERAALASAIASFFLEHDVHMSGARFMLVHDMLSGTSPELQKRYEARLKSPLGINDAWLEAIEHEQARTNSASLDRLVGEFESQLGKFQSSTRTAREATENYGNELAQQIECEMPPGGDASALAALAEKMLAQTRELTASIKSNELDTEKLQRRLDQAKREAQTDQLTGLPNRRAFEDQFARYCQIARLNNKPLCLAFCDIDNFKRVNDVHGHETGDRVLKLVGSALDKLSKSGSFVSRHGGEEFVLLFSDMALDKAAARLDQTREQLATKELLNRETDIPLGRISFSAGIVDVMQFANPRDGLQAADAALYKAKHAGKNQVLIA